MRLLSDHETSDFKRFVVTCDWLSHSEYFTSKYINEIQGTH